MPRPRPNAKWMTRQGAKLSVTVAAAAHRTGIGPLLMSLWWVGSFVGTRFHIFSQNFCFSSHKLCLNSAAQRGESGEKKCHPQIPLHSRKGASSCGQTDKQQLASSCVLFRLSESFSFLRTESKECQRVCPHFGRTRFMNLVDNSL